MLLEAGWTWTEPHPWRAARRLLAITLLAAMPRLAQANMAAPGFNRTSPVPSSPARPAGAGLTVLRETLTFEVGQAGSAVCAEYLVEAAAEADLALTFLSPDGSQAIRAWVNEEARPVTTARLVAASEADAAAAATLAPFKELYRSGFQGLVHQGENRIRVTYTQGFGLYWIPMGYFRDPLYLHVFPYELWPLKGWDLAPDFHLDLKVTLALPRAGLWSRLVGSVPSWSLHVAGSPRELEVPDFFSGPWWHRGAEPDPHDRIQARYQPLVEPVGGKLLGGTLEVSCRLGRDFPDRLYVVVDKAGDPGTE